MYILTWLPMGRSSGDEPEITDPIPLNEALDKIRELSNTGGFQWAEIEPAD